MLGLLNLGDCLGCSLLELVSPVLDLRADLLQDQVTCLLGVLLEQLKRLVELSVREPSVGQELGQLALLLHQAASKC